MTRSRLAWLARHVTSAGRLRAEGLRATQPRVVRLDVLLDVLHAARTAREHLPVAQIAERARLVLPTVSTQAVHDCLDALTRAGLARSIEPAGHPCLSPSDAAGSAVQEADVLFWGRCPGCRTKSIA